MATLEQIHGDLMRVGDQLRGLFDEIQVANGGTAEKLLRLRADRKELMTGLERVEESLQRLEEASQRVEKISPHGLAARIPKSTLEEARRIVAEAEAKGEAVSPPSPHFKEGEDISGVWMVVTDKAKFKIPNWILRGVLSAVLGGLLTYLGIAIHDVNQRPLVVPSQSSPVPAQSNPVPAQSADGDKR